MPERKIMEPADLSEKADAAFRAMVQVVIQRAKQTGTTVIIWEDDRIKEIPSDDLEQKFRQDCCSPSADDRH